MPGFVKKEKLKYEDYAGYGMTITPRLSVEHGHEGEKEIRLTTESPWGIGFISYQDVTEFCGRLLTEAAGVFVGTIPVEKEEEDG